MRNADKTYWFPAKRYGWGWGVPLCWQGWAVMAVYLAIMVGGGVLLAARGHVGAFDAVVAIATAALIAVCWRKGEPPRWRWGGE